MTDYPSDLDVRPLTTWPGELTPEHKRMRSPFGSPLYVTLATLRTELRQLNARRPVLEVAIPEAKFRIDGRPYADAKATHPGVVLSLPATSEGPLRYATDKFLTWQDNLRAIVLGLEALRRVERYGITRRGEQYQGFRAIESGARAIGSAPAMDEATAITVLRAAAEVELDADIELRYLIRAAQARSHPDVNGGDQTAWDQVALALRSLGLLDA